MSNEAPEFKARSLTCAIKFHPNFASATHELTYELYGLADQPIQEFYWDIPNASVAQVTLKECAQEGPTYGAATQPEFSKKPHPDSPQETRLTIRYNPPFKKDERIKLRFSYQAPTSTEFRKRLFIRLGTYAAPFHHGFLIESFFLKIYLPHAMTFIETIPYVSPPSKGPTVEFKKSNIVAQEYFSHHIVFCQDRRILFAVWALALFAVGYFARMFLSSEWSIVAKGTVVLVALTGISLEAIYHATIVGIFGAFLHWLSKRRSGKESHVANSQSAIKSEGREVRNVKE